MVPAAWMLAYWMRFNLQQIPPDYLDTALQTLPLVMLVCGVVYWTFGLYRGVWRFASLPDLVRITKASRPPPAVDAGAVRLSTAATTCRARCRCCSCCFQLAAAGRAAPALPLAQGPPPGLRPVRVLIVGARGAGEMLVREMRRDRRGTYDPVAFVDDKLRRQGGDIHGVPIKGGTDR
jgi:FlaA1/EpsC-like NDP-sugar epimerase